MTDTTYKLLVDTHMGDEYFAVDGVPVERPLGGDEKVLRKMQITTRRYLEENPEVTSVELVVSRERF